MHYRHESTHSHKLSLANTPSFHQELLQKITMVFVYDLPSNILVLIMLLSYWYTNFVSKLFLRTPKHAWRASIHYLEPWPWYLREKLFSIRFVLFLQACRILQFLFIVFTWISNVVRAVLHLVLTESLLTQSILGSSTAKLTCPPYAYSRILRKSHLRLRYNNVILSLYS